MLKRDEIKGPSCLTKSADDEPVFVLCARDPIASAIVRQWATLYVQHKAGGQRNMTAKQAKKVKDAVGLALLMDLWRTRTPRKP